MRRELVTLGIMLAGLALMILFELLESTNEASAIGMLAHIVNIWWRFAS